MEYVLKKPFLTINKKIKSVKNDNVFCFFNKKCFYLYVILKENINERYVFLFKLLFLNILFYYIKNK